MDVLPEAVVQHVLSFLSNARDVAACSCVCKSWKEMMADTRKLRFGRTAGPRPDRVVTHMVCSTTALQELVVLCPFSPSSLQVWLSHSHRTLKTLELRLDWPFQSKSSILEHISSSLHLEELRLWGGAMRQCPAEWGTFGKLRQLEIVGARVEDAALRGMLQACPALEELALLGCDGVKSTTIQMQHLQKCRLDFCTFVGEGSVSVRSPKLSRLEVQGVSTLRILDTTSLRHLDVGRQSGKVSRVEVGKLHVLETLSLRGLQWRWDAVDGVLRAATEVQELYMKIEFCGDGETYEPFPELELAEFFANHPKLKRFDVHGAMFAAFSAASSESLARLPLQEASITIRSPLNGQRKIQVLQAFINSSPGLQKLVLRATRMKNRDADTFFCKLLGLAQKYQFITVE